MTTIREYLNLKPKTLCYCGKPSVQGLEKGFACDKHRNWENVIMPAKDIVRLTEDTVDKVLSTLNMEKQHLDDIIEASDLPRSSVLSVLTYLELTAKIKQFSGKNWAIKEKGED